MADIDDFWLSDARPLLDELPSGSTVNEIDYLEKRFDNRFDRIIMNPPYVRQEWLDKKECYIKEFKERYKLIVPGTSNSYVYFIAKALFDLAPGGRCVCIVYDSWQSTKYGLWLSGLLERMCQSVEVIPLEGEVFNGRLIGSTILRMDKRAETLLTCPQTPSSRTYVRANNGDLNNKYAPIDQLCVTKRGLRLKQASFFLCNSSETVTLGATPFVKKINLFRGFVVPNDHPEAALLAWSTEVDDRLSSELEKRIHEAIAHPKKNESVLNWYKEYPQTWFLHQKPPYAKIIFNYYLRNRPKHVMNPTYAYSDNFYGLTPRDDIDIYAALAVLNSTYSCIAILEGSRNQGNGLAKIQLFEYRKVMVPDWRKFDSETKDKLSILGKRLTVEKNPQEWAITLDEIDTELSKVLNCAALDKYTLMQLLERAKNQACRPRC